MRTDISMGVKYLAASYMKWCKRHGIPKTLEQATRFASRHIGEWESYMSQEGSFNPDAYKFRDIDLVREFRFLGFKRLEKFPMQPNRAYITSKTYIDGSLWVWPYHFRHGAAVTPEEREILDIHSFSFSGFLANCIRMRYPAVENPRKKRRGRRSESLDY